MERFHEEIYEGKFWMEIFDDVCIIMYYIYIFVYIYMYMYIDIHTCVIYVYTYMYNQEWQLQWVQYLNIYGGDVGTKPLYFHISGE